MKKSIVWLSLFITLNLCSYASAEENVSENKSQEQNTIAKDVYTKNLDEDLIKEIDAYAKFLDKQVTRQVNSNQYVQLSSVKLIKPENDYIMEYSFRITPQNSQGKAEDFVAIVGPKMTSIACRVHDFQHQDIGNRYIFKKKNGETIAVYDVSEKTCTSKK